jgi:hypothetical protein
MPTSSARVTDRFFAASGVHLAETQRDIFHFRRAAFSSHLKSKVGRTLVKDAPLRINLNIDGTPITSRTHRLIPRSGASSNYGKTLFRLIAILRMYFDTSLKTFLFFVLL